MRPLPDRQHSFSAPHLRFPLALQVRIKATMARRRLRQVKADLTVLSIQSGGELRDQTVCLSPGLVTMPSRLPFLDESALSIFADGLLRANDFLQVY